MRIKLCLCFIYFFLLHYNVLAQTKQEGIALYNVNKYEKAYQIFENLEQKDKDDEVFLLMANILQSYKKNIDAIFCLHKGLSINPKNYKIYYNLGNLYCEDGKYFMAIKYYKNSIKYNKQFPFCYYNLANVLFKTNQNFQAKRYYKTAIMLKPDEPDFYNNLAILYKSEGNEKLYQKYIKEMEKVK